MRDFAKEVEGLAKNKTVLWGAAGVAALIVAAYFFSGSSAQAAPVDNSAGLLAGSPISYATPAAYGAPVDTSASGTSGGTTGGADLSYLTDLVNLQTLQQQDSNALGILQANNSLTLGQQSIASQTQIALANVDATKYSALTTLVANLNSTLTLNSKNRGFTQEGGTVTVGGQTASYNLEKVGNGYNAPTSMFYALAGVKQPDNSQPYH